MRVSTGIIMTHMKTMSLGLKYELHILSLSVKILYELRFLAIEPTIPSPSLVFPVHDPQFQETSVHGLISRCYKMSLLDGDLKVKKEKFMSLSQRDPAIM